MDEKKMIINDVNVSECELYRDDNGVFAPDGTAERTELCYLTNDYCGNNPSCYYKNWQRAEQKLEKIKKVCNKFIPDHYKILLIINNGVVEE